MADTPPPNQDSSPTADAIPRSAPAFDATEAFDRDSPVGVEQGALVPALQLAIASDETIKNLVELGLITGEEARSLLGQRSVAQQPQTAEEVARLLYEHGRLTRFQFEAVSRGRIQDMVLGNYVLLDRLGQGGMGQVYKARHRRLDRVVAVKTLLSGADYSREALARFQREVKAAAKLSHPNIVAAYDASESAGIPFLVMEYVDGQDLASLVRERGPLSVATAADYILQAARGLEYAHRQGVVHRDIKPSNLIADRGGTVRILDLGLARIETTASQSDSSLTDGGQLLGTLDYLSPEQALDAREADARTDVYSLGCTLHYLLLGRPPYEGDTPTKKILAHREQPTPSLSVARSDVPNWLSSLFQRMLAKEPDGRPQAMSEVIATLESQIGIRTASPAASGPTVGRASPAQAPGADGPSAVATVSLHGPDVSTSSPGQPRPVVAPSPRQPTTVGPRRTVFPWSLRQRWTRLGQGVRTALVGGALGGVLAVALGIVIVIRYDRNKLELTVEATNNETPPAGESDVSGRDATAPVPTPAGDSAKIAITPRASRPSGPNGAVLLRQLEAEIRAGVADDPADPGVESLRERLTVLARHRHGTADGLAVATLMAQLPWPADALRRENIDKYELAVAGNGDENQAPRNLVAILGDSRLKHWSAHSSVTSVGFTPDDQFLVTASGDRTVRIWEVATGRQARILIGPADASAAIVSPDGRLIAWTMGPSPKVMLQEIASGAEVGLLTHGTNRFDSWAFSPNGQICAAADMDGSIVLWDVQQKRLRSARLRGRTSSVRTGRGYIGRGCPLAFSRDGRWLASGGEDKIVNIWDVQSGELVKSLEHQNDSGALAFSPMADVLASTDGMEVKLWQISSKQAATAEPLQTLTHPLRVLSITFSPDGKTLATISGNGDLNIWNLDEAGQPSIFAARGLPLRSLAFSRDGRMLAAGTAVGSVELIDVATANRNEVEKTRRPAVFAMSVSSDGKRIASVDRDGTVHFWELPSGPRRTLIGPNDSGAFRGFNQVAFSPDNATLIVTAESGSASLRLFELPSGKHLLTRPGNSCGSIAFSPNGKYFATTHGMLTGEDTPCLSVWDTSTWKVLPEFVGTELGRRVSFSPDNTLLAIACCDGTVQIWEVATGEKKRTLKADGLQYTSSAAFSPDGRLLVTTGIDGLVKLWELTSGQCIQTLTKGIQYDVNGLAKFSPDGRVLASSASDGTVRLWDPASGKPLEGGTLRLGPPGGTIAQIDFTPDGRHLVTANGNGTLYVLRLRERDR